MQQPVRYYDKEGQDSVIALQFIGDASAASIKSWLGSAVTLVYERNSIPHVSWIAINLEGVSWALERHEWVSSDDDGNLDLYTREEFRSYYNV